MEKRRKENSTGRNERVAKKGEPTVKIAKWVRDSVQTLIEHNHRMQDIADYTLDQFTTFLDAAGRADAVKRLEFVIDMSAVVGGMFGGGNSLKDHIESLKEIESGE